MRPRRRARPSGRRACPAGRPDGADRAATPLDRADLGERRGRVDVVDHDRERLVAAVLALAQRRDRVVVGRVAGQVVAADALDRDDRSNRQQPPRTRDRGIARPRLMARAQRERRPARRAGHGLRVEPPVAGIGVLRGAQSHSGNCAIVVDGRS